MIIQWILQILAGAIVGCIRIFTKIHVRLISRSSKVFKSNEKIDEWYVRKFYNKFGFYYEDLIKYAPEIDGIVTSLVNPLCRDKVSLKMIKLCEIQESIDEAEQIDIIKFKQAIENIKNQKALENIDG